MFWQMQETSGIWEKVLTDGELWFWYFGPSVQPISKNITNALYL
jgi:hypothetical protein